MLRFQMKKKCINFGSYLDKQRMHFNAMRKINCTENTGSTWCKTAQSVPGHRPLLLVL